MGNKIKEVKDYVKVNNVLAIYMGGVIVGSFTNNLGSLDKPNIVHDHYLFDMGKTRTMNECYWSDTTMKYHKDWEYCVEFVKYSNKHFN